MPYDTAAIRKLIGEAFGSEDLTLFCDDYFRPVYEEFTEGQTKGTRVQLLIEYARRHELLDELLDKVRQANPQKYAEFEPGLKVAGEAGTPVQEKLLLEPVPTVPNFVGREAVLAAYRAELERERLVIIKGMAGVGKTTLGARLAREIAAQEEQIFWFTFDPVEKNTAEALLWAPAAFLETRGCPDLWQHLRQHTIARDLMEVRDPMEATYRLNLLLAGLSTGDYVLCFDDFQEVKKAPDILHFFDLLRQRFAGRRQDLPARLILMGREIPSEMEYLVPRPLEGFTCEEARSFVEAQNLALPPGSLALVEQLWTHTDGNPMILKLSAAALGGLGGNLAAMERFVETMAGKGDVCDYVMAEVYATLQPDEQQLAGCLSIFPTPVEWNVIEEVVEEALATKRIKGVPLLVKALVNKSVVSETEDGRIRCHSLVREYCYHVLDREDKEYFHQQAAQYYEQTRNYLVAAYHHLQRGAFGPALDLLTTHTQAIINAGGAGALLEQLSRFDQQPLSSEQWAALSQAQGDGHEIRGEYKQAVAAYEAAMQVATGKAGRAVLLYKLGSAYLQSGQCVQAIQVLTDSLKVNLTLESQAGIAQAYYALGWACYRLGRLEKAREHFAASEKTAQAMGDTLLLAKARFGLGTMAWRAGRLEEARGHFEDSRRIFRAFGERRREAEAVGNLGLTYLSDRREDLNQALSYCCQALEIQEKIGDVQGLCIACNNVGYLYGLLGDHRQAIRYYERLAQLAQDTGHKPMLSIAHSDLADAHLALEDPHRALEHARQAWQVAQDAGLGVELGMSCRVLGDVWLALAEPEQARTWFERSIPLLEQAGEDEELVKARRGLGRALQETR